MKSFEGEASERRDALVSMALALSSHARFANETWPYVSLPDFEWKAELTRNLADVIAIMVLPLVRKHQLEDWAEYSSSNMGWYWEGLQAGNRGRGIVSENRGDTGVDHFDAGFLNTSGEILQFQEDGPDGELVHVEETDEGPFFPVW